MNSDAIIERDGMVGRTLAVGAAAVVAAAFAVATAVDFGTTLARSYCSLACHGMVVTHDCGDETNSGILHRPDWAVSNCWRSSAGSNLRKMRRILALIAVYYRAVSDGDLEAHKIFT